MYNFNLQIPTKIHFGKGMVVNLGKDILEYSDKVLLVYGGGSIKKNGIYKDVTDELIKNKIEWVELADVDPNPRIESVREGIKLCRQHDLGGVLAVGGGSSIDCAKVIAAGVKYDKDPWDLVVDKKIMKDALPIFSVLTLAATGSEMDPNAVISDMATNQKLGTGAACTVPKVSILDPEYTYSVPAKHTAAGVADIMSHTFENYFNTNDAYMQARMAEAILKTCIHYGPIALAQPENYDARANLMWASTWAINGLLAQGASHAWSVHPMEHELSAFYDVTHGEGLAVLTPAWMRYVLNEDNIDRFVEYGVNVWGIDKNLDKLQIANMAIDLTEDFFANKMNIPMSLSKLGIGRENFEKMSVKAMKGKDSIKGMVELRPEDVVKIYEMCL
ncbi:iron-containing alcohol dehydrogenase [Peptostreptococcus anaerobius]|uniref:iron-containing alcohol dehydrogenase n=1 Tax=Peptostreptococcus anaerobius TaxID=1261 RepID=UPI0034A36256